MNHEDIADALALTLEDHRLTRTERRALDDLVSTRLPDESDRAFLRNEAFRLADEAVANEPDAAPPVLEWLRGVMKVLASTEVRAGTTTICFSPGEEPRTRIRSLLREARATIDVAVFTITDDVITREMIAAHDRGVRVRVVTDDDKAHDRGSDADALAAAGIALAFDETGHMHHKFAIFDRRVVLNGSYNWTRGAARENHENIVTTDDAVVATRFTEEFENLWSLYAR